MIKYVLHVDGMMCGMCEAHVNDAVRKAAPVQNVTSSHSKGVTEVICEDTIDINAVKAAIEADGYKVTSVTEEKTEKKGFLSKLFGNK